jgi:hypothetical protein
MAVDFFKYEKRYNYPHMKPRDIEIWERFIAKYPDAYDTCQYDFSVGDVPPFMEQRSSREGQAMKELYKSKIDVLGYKGATIDLIEVKPDAGASSIGQLLGYVSLYKRDMNPSNPVRPVIITDTLRTNMDFLTKEQGVTLIIV